MAEEPQDNQENATDDDAVAAEWEQMAGGDDDGDGAKQSGDTEPDDDAMATEWDAAAGGEGACSSTDAPSRATTAPAATTETHHA